MLADRRARGPATVGVIAVVDDGKLAWELRRDGRGWDEIARELNCLPVVAQARADAYERRTDAAAADAQFELF